MRFWRRFAFLAVASIAVVACDGGPAGEGPGEDGGAATTDGGDSRLPPEMCGLVCVDPPYSASSIGLNPEFACYDDCNWHYCTTDGPQLITARACSDAGVLDAGP